MRVALFLAALVAAAPAAAQNASPDPREPEIIVQGTRPTDRQIEEFVEAVAREPGRVQLGRFDMPVCPLAAGLSPTQNATIERRLRSVAAAAGIPVARGKCEPNVFVAVTRDKAQLMRQMKKERPSYFPHEYRHAIARLAADPTPVAAWQVEGLGDHEGGPVRAFSGTAAAFGTLNDPPSTVSDPHHGASRIRLPAHPQFLSSVVLMEMGAVAGLTTTQLADYAAMRAYARIDPARLKSTSIPTILKALDTAVGGQVPITLTVWDLSYLKALYSTSSDQFASQQRGHMRERLSELLQGERKSADR